MDDDVPVGDDVPTRTAAIDSRLHWVRTGIMLRGGHEYQLRATGHWTDLHYRCEADGYPSTSWLFRRFEWARRVPGAQWFALIGAMDLDRSDRFVIGKQASYRPASDGELLCFANDLWLTYFNNQGAVELQVTEIAD